MSPGQSPTIVSSITKQAHSISCPIQPTSLSRIKRDGLLVGRLEGCSHSVVKMKTWNNDSESKTFDKPSNTISRCIHHDKNSYLCWQNIGIQHFMQRDYLEWLLWALTFTSSIVPSIALVAYSMSCSSMHIQYNHIRHVIWCDGQLKDLNPWSHSTEQQSKDSLGGGGNLSIVNIMKGWMEIVTKMHSIINALVQVWFCCGVTCSCSVLPSSTFRTLSSSCKDRTYDPLRLALLAQLLPNVCTICWVNSRGIAGTKSLNVSNHV